MAPQVPGAGAGIPLTPGRSPAVGRGEKVEEGTAHPRRGEGRKKKKGPLSRGGIGTTARETQDRRCTLGSWRGPYAPPQSRSRRSGQELIHEGDHPQYCNQQHTDDHWRSELAHLCLNH